MRILLCDGRIWLDWIGRAKDVQMPRPDTAPRMSNEETQKQTFSLLHFVHESPSYQHFFGLCLGVPFGFPPFILLLVLGIVGSLVVCCISIVLPLTCCIKVNKVIMDGHEGGPLHWLLVPAFLHNLKDIEIGKILYVCMHSIYTICKE